MREFTALMRLAELEYMVRPVRVAITRDHGVGHVDGIEVELRKGIEIEVPYWIAKALEEDGIGHLTESPLTLEDLARIHYTMLSARTPAEVEALPQYFYQEVKEYLRRIDEKIRRELNPSLLEEKQKAQQYLMEIVDKRLTLIIQSLRSPTTIAELTSKLTPEEQAIARIMLKLIETWRKNILPKGLVSGVGTA